MHQPYKLKAGALLSVIGIAIVIAILLGLMLLLLLYNRNDTSRQIRKLKLQSNLESATALALSRDYEKGELGVERLDLFGEETDSIILQYYHWGIYDVAIIKSFENSDTVSTVFLKGNHINKEKSYALYLMDDERPLSVSGATVIRGTAYLPPAGVRKAYIEDKAYEADSAIFGMIKTSEKKLPAINTSCITQLKQLFYDSLTNWKDTMISFENIKDSLSRSFFQQAVIVASEDSISLENTSLQGALILVSKKAVYIPSTAKIEQLLVLAPKIKIADGFQGNLQAFAQDSILVGENCSLSYPSALGLIEMRAENAVPEQVPEIVIGKHSRMNGIVFSIAEKEDQDFLNRILLSEESLITGEVYADGLLELRGQVYGSVACRRFLLRTPSSLYDNFVLDAEIDYTKRSRYYIGGALLDNDQQGGIVKWLN